MIIMELFVAQKLIALELIFTVSPIAAFQKRQAAGLGIH